MNVIILAAGYGTRLEQFGVSLPKGLIEIHGKTILSQLLENISTIPYHNILLVTNNRFLNLYKQFCTDVSCSNLELLSDTTDSPGNRLGGVGDLLFALDSKHWWNEDLLVCPSDTPTQLQLTDFISFTDTYAKDSSATIFKQVPKDQIANRLGCATLDDNNIITGFFEKPQSPPSDLSAIPFYFYSKTALAFIKNHRDELLDEKGKIFDAPGNLIKWLVTKKQLVFGYVIKKQAIDVGTVEDIETANAKFLPAAGRQNAK